MHPRWLARSTLVLALAGCPGPSATSETAVTETSITTVSASSPTEATETQSPTIDSSGLTTDNPTSGPGCVPPDQRCKGDDHQICAGGAWLDSPCPAGSGCEPSSGLCQTCECTDPPTCLDAMTLETCDCLASEQITCPMGQGCDAALAACADVVCTPGVQTCAGQAGHETCNSSGTGFTEPVACAGSELCDPDLGTCQSACAVVAKRQSSIGCEFWGVDMANAFEQATDIYAVAVSNPSGTNPVNVDIYDGNAQGAEQKLLGGVIAPRQVKIFLLSGTKGNQSGFYPGDAGFLTSGIGAGRAFRIKSDLPIVATQFNPLGGASAFTTDASLLLPTHALGTRYFHLAWQEGLGSGSSLVVIATAENTKISLTPTVSISAQNGLPALTAGVTTEVTLGAYDYVQLQSNSGDLTGSEIVANKPVAVFGGHSCGNVPDKATNFCDHLEEQIFPVDTWGHEYVALRSPKRADEDMHWRVLARESGATVTFTPKPEGLDNAVQDIPPGGFLHFSASSDFRVTADHPILVAGYIYGSKATGLAGDPGDPSMVLMVPVEQWLGDYVFLVDSSYTNDNVRLVRKSMNNNVELGCLGPVPDDRWQAIPGTPYVTAVVNIQPGEGACEPGTNTASAKSTTFGIIVVGEAQGASYAYPGGMALKEIAPG